MKIQLGLYRSNVPFITHCYNTCKHGDLVKLVSEISSSIPIPCVVVNSFLQEIVGPTKELQKNLENLKKIYSIEEIIE